MYIYSCIYVCCVGNRRKAWRKRRASWVTRSSCCSRNNPPAERCRRDATISPDRCRRRTASSPRLRDRSRTTRRLVYLFKPNCITCVFSLNPCFCDVFIGDHLFEWASASAAVGWRHPQPSTATPERLPRGHSHCLSLHNRHVQVPQHAEWGRWAQYWQPGTGHALHSLR